MPKPLKEAVVDDDRTLTIGDPIVAARSGDGPAPGWQVTYHGTARSCAIGDVRWEAGQTHVLSDMTIVMRAQRTAHFQVLPPRSCFTVGRVHKIYRSARAEAEFWFGQREDADEYEFIVVSPSGELYGFKQDEVRTPAAAELDELAEAERAEIQAGRMPYRGRLKLQGPGRWGRGVEL